eukprot:TRINITY_DN2788_c2_g1_i3.p1 TRINITY_DN2788_c2_g1~~TRINITY_DN2788_c2_g1_i3.p1  ORF type:complete len:470 (+),score=192.77 TRINITY_DN2788_c2_g1_i3:59-1411(+)
MATNESDSFLRKPKYEHDYYEDDQPMNEFIIWLEDLGFDNHQGLRIGSTDLGRGMVATKAFECQNDITIVPREAILGDDSKIIGDNGRVGEFLRQNITEGLELVALMILYERFVRAENSFWYPWIKILPKQLSHTVYWNEEELNEVRGCALYELTHCLHRQLQKKHLEYKKLLVPDYFPEEALTLENYKWAICSSWARTFLITVYDEFDDSKHTNVTAFVPFADMLNYHAERNCKAQLDASNKFFRIWAPWPISKGEQLFVEYGNKGNTELMMYYGFHLENNPFSAVRLSFCIEPNDRFLDKKKQILKSQIDLEPFLTGSDGAQWFEVQIGKVDLTYAVEEDQVKVLPFLRVLVCDDENELDIAVKEIKNILSLTNELNIYVALKMKCESLIASYPTTPADDLKILSTENLSNYHRFAAIKTRLEEKQILMETVSRTEIMINDLNQAIVN